MKIMTDSPIRFPGLFGDWAITISSKAIDIGNGIYWYGILIALGMLVALWWCMRQRTKYGIREDDLIDGLLWGIPSAIVGARLYYVLFYLSEFKDHEGHFSWSKAIAIWDGGLAIYGGVIAVVIVAIILCRSRHIKLGAMMDLVVMGLLIGQAIGRWGNFLNREAFGAETALPWRMQLTTTAGELVEVHPTFLYESLWNVIGLLLIVLWYPRPGGSMVRTPASTSCGTARAASGSRACAPTACICSTGPSPASPSGCPRC